MVAYEPVVVLEEDLALGRGRRAVRLANPLSEERPLLRTSVLGSLVDVLRRNVSRGHKDVALFEMGLVFRPGGPLRRAPIPGSGPRPRPPGSPA